MASQLSSQSALIFRAPLGRHVRSPVIVRAQLTGDEGGQSRNDIVDSNLSVLRERIEQVRMKERLKRCNQSTEGWYYSSGYDIEIKRSARLSEIMQVAGMAVGSFGFSVASGTICLCLLSLLIHLSNQG